MKKLIFFLVISTSLQAEERSLENRGWLIVKCHDENKNSSFEISISSDDLNGVRQITEASYNGELLRSIQSDTVEIEPKPLVGLASIHNNDLKFVIRYESNLMWDTYLRATMKFSENGYQSEISVTGDEGTYYDVTKAFQCWIGNNGHAFLQTTSYRGE